MSSACLRTFLSGFEFLETPHFHVTSRDGFLCPSAVSVKRPEERRGHGGARRRRREEEADPAGEGRQMEIDGGRDLEMKRNTPLGVTEEGGERERDERPTGLRG